MNNKFKLADQSLKDKLYRMLESKIDRMIEIRRYLHQHPEVSFEEKETSKYIANFYKNMDINIETDYGDGYGIVITIDSGKPGKTVALRADFDALAVQEETGLDYQSKKPGKMHACGHDGHTAYMLILAECLNKLKNEFEGKIKIIHQPAEEVPPGGAQSMIEAGVLDGVDAILGVHGWASIKYGTIQCTKGAVMTGRYNFKLRIHGKGGHGAAPHLANDANVAASYFVTMAQSIISRRVNPFDMATLTIGNFDGKGSFNVIKDSVFLEGDIRFMKAETGKVLTKWFHNLVNGLEIIFGVKINLQLEKDYPVLNNDDELTELVQNSLKNSNISELKIIDTVTRNTASEDFAYYTNKISGVYMFVGEMPDDGIFYPHHNPKFIINEKALPLAAKIVGAVALDILVNK